MFPERGFDYAVIKTTGDRLQKASMAAPAPDLPKGLFTKELEVALLEGRADFAVHSLKDLPTDLPEGLRLGAVPERADVRDVLIRLREGQMTETGDSPSAPLGAVPVGAIVATSSTRRRVQLLAMREDLQVVEIRGNVGTRLRKLRDDPALRGTLLAAAGLHRLGYTIASDGTLVLPGSTDGSESNESGEGSEFMADFLPVERMLPCVGQAALGIEIRADDPTVAEVCDRFTDLPVHRCVMAERAFLRAMGGGCQSPVAALAEIVGDAIRLRAASFVEGPGRMVEANGPAEFPERLGERVAEELR